MGSSTLTWNYDSASGDGFRIYRSDTPMDPEALPTPLAEVDIALREYIDATVVADQTYYYRVSVYIGTTEKVSEELEHIAVISDYPLPLVNTVDPANMTGWTVTAGTWVIGGSTPNRYFYGRSASTYAHQDATVPAELEGHVDAGIMAATLDWLFGGWSGDGDKGECGLTFLNAANVEISTAWSGLITSSDGGVNEAHQLVAAIPAGTRKIRVRMHGSRVSGTDLNAYWRHHELKMGVATP